MYRAKAHTRLVKALMSNNPNEVQRADSEVAVLAQSHQHAIWQEVQHKSRIKEV